MLGLANRIKANILQILTSEIYGDPAPADVLRKTIDYVGRLLGLEGELVKA
jgi:hypothetical protein